MQALATQFVDAWQSLVQSGTLRISLRNDGPLDWLYLNYEVDRLLVIISLCVQGLFFVLRRDFSSLYWRIGASFALLGMVLGNSVWSDPYASTRVVLPMTLCFYLQLARERGTWFWTFFMLGGLAWPYGVHELWTYV